MSSIYYCPKGYWKGLAAIKKLALAAKVSEDAAKEWLKKQTSDLANLFTSAATNSKTKI